jgi:hypothetical protein
MVGGMAFLGPEATGETVAGLILSHKYGNMGQ